MRGLGSGNAEVDHDPSSGKGTVKQQHMKVGLTGLGMPCDNVGDRVRIDTPVPDSRPHQPDGGRVGHVAAHRQVDRHEVTFVTRTDQLLQRFVHAICRSECDRAVQD